MSAGLDFLIPLPRLPAREAVCQEPIILSAGGWLLRPAAERLVAAGIADAMV